MFRKSAKVRSFMTKWAVLLMANRKLKDQVLGIACPVGFRACSG